MHIKTLNVAPKSAGSRNYIPGDFVNNNDTSKSTSPTDTRSCVWHPVHSFLLKQTNKEFTPDLMFTKYEANHPCNIITYISTKGIGHGVSHPV